MANWCYVQDVSGILRETDNEELSVDQKYAIFCNGKRYKKDSREWLHKTSKRKRSKIGIETEGDSEEANKYKCIKCRRNYSTLRDLLRDINSNKHEMRGKDAKVHSCTSYFNVDERAKSPEMFVNYRKRRLVSPNCLNCPHAVISDQELNSNISERWPTVDRYFMPIAENQERELQARFTLSDYGIIGDSLGIPWPENFQRDSSVTGSNITETNQDSTSCWRSTRSIPSDSSTVSTPSDDILDTSTTSPSSAASLAKRCKRQKTETNQSGDNSVRKENVSTNEEIFEETQSLSNRTAYGSPRMSFVS